jgi:hypothetical protein
MALTPTRQEMADAIMSLFKLYEMGLIVNLSETPYDEMCDLLIRGKAGSICHSLKNSPIDQNKKGHSI